MERDFSTAKKIMSHIRRVEDNMLILAEKLFDTDSNFSLELIKRARLHDLSKFNIYEFKNLHDDSPPAKFLIALDVHRKGNRHHPEYFTSRNDSIHDMEDLDIAEMVCDCLARAQEFGSDIKDFFFNYENPKCAPAKYNYTSSSPIVPRIEKYLELILTKKFNS